MDDITLFIEVLQNDDQGGFYEYKEVRISIDQLKKLKELLDKIP